MTADPIRAALEAAVNAHTVDAWTLEDEHRAWLTQNMAGAIAAYHRAVSEHPSTCRYDAAVHRLMAAAVERAARGGEAADAE